MQTEFLNCYLTRNLVHFQVEQSKSKESCVIMERVVSFLVNTFKLVNEFIAKLGYSEYATSSKPTFD